VGDPSSVHEPDCRQEEAACVAGGLGPDGPQPPARGEGLKQFVTRVRGVSCNLPCSLQGPGSKQVKQVLEGRRTLSAERMVRCSLALSLAVAAGYQTVMEEQRI